jgi:SAM-dependent methyltransferase
MANSTNVYCPSCGNASVKQQFAAEDFTVSHQLFGIWECTHCALRFTQPVPDMAAIGGYYKATAYISHTDTKEGFINKLYHIIRKRTLQKKRRLVEGITGHADGTLLDIGAGTGAFAHTMKKAGWAVTGLEPDAVARQKASERYGLSLRPPEELFQLPPASVDVITLWHVLEHVHNLHGYLQQVKLLLKPGGKVFIAVPNYTSYDAGVYKQYWAAYDVPRHLYHFSPVAMQRLLEQHQLKQLSLNPMWFDSFYVAMLSEQYRTGRNHIIRAGWVGLLSNLVTFFHKKRCSSLIYIAGNN